MLKILVFTTVCHSHLQLLNNYDVSYIYVSTPLHVMLVHTTIPISHHLVQFPSHWSSNFLNAKIIGMMNGDSKVSNRDLCGLHSPHHML